MQQQYCCFLQMNLKCAFLQSSLNVFSLSSKHICRTKEVIPRSSPFKSVRRTTITRRTTFQRSSKKRSSKFISKRTLSGLTGTGSNSFVTKTKSTCGLRSIYYTGIPCYMQTFYMLFCISAIDRHSL